MSNKVVGVGSAGVGKTCLIKHFCETKLRDIFNIVGAPNSITVFQVVAHSNVKVLFMLDLMRVHLWDLSGNPEYADVRNELYGSTDAIFLVFDVSNAASFADLEAWLREIVKYNNPMPEVCLVANKIDLRKKGGVSQTDAKKWASRHKLNYYETSCATGDGVEKMFSELLIAVLQKRKIGNKPN